MRRLPRVILTVLTATFVVLWLGAAGLWVRSHWRGDSYLRPGNPRSWLVMSGDGGMAIALCSHPNTPSVVVTSRAWESDPTPQYPTPGQWARSLRWSGKITVNTSVTTGLTVAPTTSAVSTATKLTFSGGAVTFSAAPIPRPSAGSSLTLNTTSFSISGVDSDLASIPLPNSGTVRDAQFHAYRVLGTGSNPARTWVLIFPYWCALVILSIPMVGLVWVTLTARR